jgi:hypothetical protein
MWTTSPSLSQHECCKSCNTTSTSAVTQQQRDNQTRKTSIVPGIPISCELMFALYGPCNSTPRGQSRLGKLPPMRLKNAYHMGCFNNVELLIFESGNQQMLQDPKRTRNRSIRTPADGVSIPVIR